MISFVNTRAYPSRQLLGHLSERLALRGGRRELQLLRLARAVAVGQGASAPRESAVNLVNVEELRGVVAQRHVGETWWTRNVSAVKAVVSWLLPWVSVLKKMPAGLPTRALSALKRMSHQANEPEYLHATSAPRP
ncbi:hypothetical protein PR003_g21051 [Phytophthora rubi]|uniref:Uncharacterized protein n=1 Tax=Phytophthora rubi TaxID=129364 RepID=A0A6A4DRC2_9STRA|nr:hypothetical protein PR001_g19951 [Phytophthora rubi]KAE9307221.1 hypothetical protein PR003_g21051 [Phytophthora rubi]